MRLLRPSGSQRRDVTVASGDIILSYEFGNQINSSSLKIYENGKVVRKEKKGGGKEYVTLPSIRLTQETLAKLEESIEQISEALTQKMPGKLSAFGSSSGKLEVYADSRKKYVVVGVVWNAKKNDIVTYSLAAKARDWVLSLVHSLVENDIYKIKFSAKKRR